MTPLLPCSDSRTWTHSSVRFLISPRGGHLLNLKRTTFQAPGLPAPPRSSLTCSPNRARRYLHSRTISSRPAVLKLLHGEGARMMATPVGLTLGGPWLGSPKSLTRVRAPVTGSTRRMSATAASTFSNTFQDLNRYSSIDTGIRRRQPCGAVVSNVSPRLMAAS
jgi:hypothetical protein